MLRSEQAIERRPGRRLRGAGEDPNNPSLLPSPGGRNPPFPTKAVLSPWQPVSSAIPRRLMSLVNPCRLTPSSAAVRPRCPPAHQRGAHEAQLEGAPGFVQRPVLTVPRSPNIGGNADAGTTPRFGVLTARTPARSEAPARFRASRNAPARRLCLRPASPGSRRARLRRARNGPPGARCLHAGRGAAAR